MCTKTEVGTENLNGIFVLHVDTFQKLSAEEAKKNKQKNNPKCENLMRTYNNNY